jgi:hypothetical protein
MPVKKGSEPESLISGSQETILVNYEFLKRKM